MIIAPDKPTVIRLEHAIGAAAYARRLLGLEGPETIVAGSIRRRVRLVKDIELVTPMPAEGQRDALLEAIEANFAVADLALAEGVHQAVRGNYDRVGSTLEAWSKGTFPPEPDIIQTPRSGVSLTHRVGLHFDTGVPFDHREWAAAATPRAPCPRRSRSCTGKQVASGKKFHQV